MLTFRFGLSQDVKLEGRIAVSNGIVAVGPMAKCQAAVLNAMGSLRCGGGFGRREMAVRFCWGQCRVAW